MEPSEYDAAQEVFTNISVPDKPKKSRKTKPGKCSVCGRVFSDKRSIIAHMRIHTGEKPYVCDDCGRGFHQRNNLIRHIRAHRKEKPFYCEVCDKHFAFQSKPYFDQHVRSHIGERPFICKLCGKSYSFRASYVSHMRAHENKNIFVCDVCHSGFSCEGRLNNHKQIHDPNQKLHMCDLCKRVFRRKYNRDMHLESSHNILIAYECKVCNQRYSDLKSLRMHNKQHHAEEVNSPSTAVNKKKKYHSVPQQSSSNLSNICRNQNVPRQGKSNRPEIQIYSVCSIRNSNISSVTENKADNVGSGLENIVESVSDVTENEKDKSGARIKPIITQEKLELFLGDTDSLKHRFLCGVCKEEFGCITDINQHLSTHTDD